MGTQIVTRDSLLSSQVWRLASKKEGQKDNRPWASIAAARKCAELGLKVLFLAASKRAATRLLVYAPDVACPLWEGQSLIQVCDLSALEDLHFFCKGSFDVVICDVAIGRRVPLAPWRAVQEWAKEHGATTLLAVRSSWENKRAKSLQDAKRFTCTSAKKAGLDTSIAWAESDTSSWLADSKRVDAWEEELSTWSAPIIEVDQTNVEADAEQIRDLTAQALWEKHKTRWFWRELELAVGRTLNHMDMRSELANGNLSRACALRSLDFAKKIDRLEAHTIACQILQEDRAIDRHNLCAQRELALQILAPFGWAEQVKKGEAIQFSWAGEGERERLERLCTLPKHLIPEAEFLFPQATPILDRLRGEGSGADTLRFTTCLLHFCGYSDADVVQRNGVKTATWRSVVSTPIGKKDDASNSNKSPSRVIPLVVYKGTTQKSQKQGIETATFFPIFSEPDYTLQNREEGGRQAGVRVDKDLWARTPVALSGDNDSAREIVCSTIPQLCQGDILWTPTTHRPARGLQSGRQYTELRFEGKTVQLQSIPKSHRPAVRAVPGRSFFNFDFSSCHTHFAAKKVQGTQLAAILSASDSYQEFAEVFGISRGSAKVALLALLNGGGLKQFRTHVQGGSKFTEQILQRVFEKWKKWLAPWKHFTCEFHKSREGRFLERPDANSAGAAWLQEQENRLLQKCLTAIKTNIPDMRLVLPIYDGALLDYPSKDPCELERVGKELEKTLKSVIQAEYPAMGVTLGWGGNWAEAEEERPLPADRSQFGTLTPKVSPLRLTQPTSATQTADRGSESVIVDPEPTEPQAVITDANIYPDEDDGCVCIVEDDDSCATEAVFSSDMD